MKHATVKMYDHEVKGFLIEDREDVIEYFDKILKPAELSIIKKVAESKLPLHMSMSFDHLMPYKASVELGLMQVARVQGMYAVGRKWSSFIIWTDVPITVEEN